MLELQQGHPLEELLHRYLTSLRGTVQVPVQSFCVAQGCLVQLPEPVLVMPESFPLSGIKRSSDRRGCTLWSQVLETLLVLVVPTYYVKYFGKW